MKDLTDRILWRAGKKDLPLDMYKCDPAMVRLHADFVPLLCYKRGNSYTSIGNIGIQYRNSTRENFATYEDVGDIKIETLKDAHLQDRIFLEGPRDWVVIPFWPDFHGFASILLMCMRMSGTRV